MLRNTLELNEQNIKQLKKEQEKYWANHQVIRIVMCCFLLMLILQLTCPFIQNLPSNVLLGFNGASML